MPLNLDDIETRISQSRQDVPALIAEVRLLRDILDTMVDVQPDDPTTLAERVKVLENAMQYAIYWLLPGTSPGNGTGVYRVLAKALRGGHS